MNESMSLALNTSIDNMGFSKGVNACINDWGQQLGQLSMTYYPTYHSYWTPNKTEQAFKLVQKLMEKNLVKVKTVKDFLELTNEIISIL
jgi:hypothetical protein